MSSTVAASPLTGPLPAVFCFGDVLLAPFCASVPSTVGSPLAAFSAGAGAGGGGAGFGLEMMGLARFSSC